jgi:glycosyltransferase involved in cell wall biosynthesis
LIDGLKGREEELVYVLTQAPSEVGDADGVFRSISLNPSDVVRSIRVLRNLRPEILHVQFAVPTWGLQFTVVLLLVLYAKICLRSRIIFTFHEVKRELEVLRIPGSLLYRLLARTADRLIVHTDESRQLLMRRCGADDDRITVMPHGVLATFVETVDNDPSTVRTEVGVPEGAVVALCFGYIHPDKGLEHAIAAIAKLSKNTSSTSVPPVHLVIAGAVRPRQGIFKLFQRQDNVYEERLKLLVDELEIEKRIHFVGYVPNSKLRALLQSADVIVIPYVSSTQSGALNLAVAAGRPIIASDLSGLRSDLGEAGVFVPAGDPDALASALMELSGSPQRREQLRARVAELRESAGLSATIDRLQAVYRS